MLKPRRKKDSILDALDAIESDAGQARAKQGAHPPALVISLGMEPGKVDEDEDEDEGR